MFYSLHPDNIDPDNFGKNPLRRQNQNGFPSKVSKIISQNFAPIRLHCFCQTAYEIRFLENVGPTPQFTSNIKLREHQLWLIIMPKKDSSKTATIKERTAYVYLPTSMMLQDWKTPQMKLNSGSLNEKISRELDAVFWRLATRLTYRRQFVIFV
jgi:hypothetical protein